MTERDRVAPLIIRGYMSAIGAPQSLRQIAAATGLDRSRVQAVLVAGIVKGRYVKADAERYGITEKFGVSIPEAAHEKFITVLKTYGPLTRGKLSEHIPWCATRAPVMDNIAFHGITCAAYARGEIWIERSSVGTSRRFVYGLPWQPRPVIGEIEVASEIGSKAISGRIRAVLSASSEPIGVAAVARLAEIGITDAEAVLQAEADCGRYHCKKGLWAIDRFWKIAGIEQATSDLIKELERTGPQARKSLGDVLSWCGRELKQRWMMWFGISRVLADRGVIWVLDDRADSPVIGLASQPKPSVLELPPLKTRRGEVLMQIRRPAAPVRLERQSAFSGLLGALASPTSQDPAYAEE